MTEAAQAQTFRVTLEQLSGFAFNVRFDGLDVADLLLDEPEPLGGSSGPNASRVLAAAAANCLSASLLFCLARAKIELDGVTTTVTGTLERNDRGRFRVAGLDVSLQLRGIPEDRARVRRCLSLFEDYCVVTASIRDGIPVTVAVVDEDGERLDAPEPPGTPDPVPAADAASPADDPTGSGA